MGKWTNKILRSEPPLGTDAHIPLEGIAQLADGRVDPKQREQYAFHLNHCSECYQLLQETLIDMPEEIIEVPAQGRWRGKPLIALAASVILMVLIGGNIIFNTVRPPPFLMASLTMDQGLMDILVEDEQMVWEKGERVDRLAALLQSRGLDVKALNRVELSAPYFASKSFTGPGEILTVRIEDGVAYLEVKAETTDKGEIDDGDTDSM